MRKILAIVGVFLILAACAKPLPEDKLRYVGYWESKEMGLLILADGSVAYERIQKGVSTSITGPLKAFDGDNFVVGLLFMTTTFEVSSPPEEVDGEWYMTVDGVRLTRTKE